MHVYLEDLPELRGCVVIYQPSPRPWLRDQLSKSSHLILLDKYVQHLLSQWEVHHLHHVASHGLFWHRTCTNERVAHHSLISLLLQHKPLESSPTYIKYVHNLLSETANKMYICIYICKIMSLKYLVIYCKSGNFCVWKYSCVKCSCK